MVDVRPFRGLVYNPEIFPDLSPVIAPPYDVISAETARRFQKANEFNISALTLPTWPPSRKRGRSYTRAAESWDEWQKRNIVVRNKGAAIWRIHEIFGSSRRKVTRVGFVAVLRLEDYSPQGVRRHENIHPEAREDRLRFLEKTGLNPGPILFVYPDSPEDTASLESSFNPDSQTRAVGPDDENVTIHVSFTTNAHWIERFQAYLKPRPVLIADGHHRYAACLALRRRNPLDPSIDSGWVMGLFLPASSPGLAILPVHRAVRQVDDFDPVSFENRLRQFFDPAPSGEDDPSLPTLSLVYGTRDPVTFRIRREILHRLEGEIEPLSAVPLSPILVDRIILEKVLKLPSSGIARQKIISYFHDREACVKAVARGEFQMAILVNPVSMEDLLSVTDRGGVLPQKSTYFYPKCPDGIVMHSLRSQ
ncbi:MAG: DUF1015 family protein [Fidelibacterota bacterium]